ncbi:hypothetical protein N7540_001042 [Penicillium herquei]|nr:hypothetical protein N7540_001042 [Penicillium herquei]
MWVWVGSNKFKLPLQHAEPKITKVPPAGGAEFENHRRLRIRVDRPSKGEYMHPEGLVES